MELLHLSSKFKWVFIICICALGANAQDPTFSQFYLNKTYLNPAYAGHTKDLGVGFQSRYQWTGVPGMFNTTTAHMNIGNAGTGMGYGLQLYNNVEGEGRLRTQTAAMQASYNTAGRFGRQLGKKLRGRKYILSFGLQGAVSQKSIDYTKFTFTDQLDPYDGIVQNRTALPQGGDVSNIIIDVSAGIRYRFEVDRRGSYVSLGAAMFHMNKPQESFYGYEAYLQPRYTGHMFYHFQTKKFVNNPSYLSIGYVVDKQQVLQTNTIYIAKDLVKYFTLGFAFRRMNIIQFDHNNDSFITQFTFSKDNLTVGYSYDVTVSSLGAFNTYGTHELGIIYVISGTELKRRKKRTDRHNDCFFMDGKMGQPMKP